MILVPRSNHVKKNKFITDTIGLELPKLKLYGVSLNIPPGLYATIY